MALLLAFVCLWISGGAVLHHTDDDDSGLLQTFAAGKSLLSHAAPALPTLPCAACQWEQNVPPLDAPGIAVVQLPFSRTTFAPLLPLTLHLRCFDYTTLRGPPRFLA